MAIPALSRRLFLRKAPLAVAAAGAVVSTAALAVPAVEAAKPVFVRVGHPSFFVPPEIVAAIKDYQGAVKARDAALAEFDALSRSKPYVHVAMDHPVRAAWFEADDAKHQAQCKLLKLVERLSE